MYGGERRQDQGGAHRLQATLGGFEAYLERMPAADGPIHPTRARRVEG